MPDVVAIITTLDNLPILKDQVRILGGDPCVSRIVIVCNGSKDGTEGWLRAQTGVKTIIKDNNGAGPGRNAGIDFSGAFDYALFLDGGIRPLVGGTQRMLDYLVSTPEADVIGVEVADFSTSAESAWRRWPDPILPEHTYANRCLSHTAYCLTRAKAWDGLRFTEEGPFSEPGWGVDDDEMACQWLDAGIVVHVVTNVHPYRRASGSFRRLFQETGVWPNQYGSVYEKRLVWMQHHWPQYAKGTMWGPPKVVVVVEATNLEQTIETVKATHDYLRQFKQPEPWERAWLPYHILVRGGDAAWVSWAKDRCLRQHHGDKIIIDGSIVCRNTVTEPLWTGDFIMCSDGWEDYVWPGAVVVNLSHPDHVTRISRPV